MTVMENDSMQDDSYVIQQLFNMTVCNTIVID